jgi:hypothetical protein
MKIKELIYSFLAIVIGACFFISCGNDKHELLVDPLKSDTEISTEISTEIPPDCNFIKISSIELSEVEKEMLLYVREEEKMARDVYLFIAERFKMPIFKNIAKSEQVHMDKVLCLLIHYNIEDPAQGPGVFTNPGIQELYDMLVALGSGPITDALTAGAIIEDYDIYDINHWMTETQNENILTVFGNIVCGSGNHLIEFDAKLNSFGIQYIPDYISKTEYDAIIASGHQTCGP